MDCLPPHLPAAKRTFQDQQAKLVDLDDPLSVYDTYFQAIQLSQPTANPAVTKLLTVELVELLDKATKAFVQDCRYRNDPRYLRLWLAYAKYCRDPEDIFGFLSVQGIALELATYYEEYARYLEKKAIGTANSLELLNKCESIYRMGIEKRAQPLERLKKKYSEFRDRINQPQNNQQGRGPRMSWSQQDVISHPWTETKIVAATPKGRPVEIRGYNSQLVADGLYSFEEQRAKAWYLKPKIAKPFVSAASKTKIQPSNLVLSPAVKNSRINAIENYATTLNDDDEDEDEGVPNALGVSVNADDLTHINVFKDNTADLREIAKLVKQKQTQGIVHKTEVKAASNNNYASTNANANANVNANLQSPDWLLKELLSPTGKKAQAQVVEERQRVQKNLARLSLIPEELENLNNQLNQQQHRRSNEKPPTIQYVDKVVQREESLLDLLDPFDPTFRKAQMEAVLSQIAEAIPNMHLQLKEPAMNKVRAFEKSLGRDGSGPNHTVSSLKIPSGHFFMEQKLGEGGYGKVYLAVDLLAEESEDGDEKVNQVAIKLEVPSSVWEAYILFRVHSFLAPQAANFSRHFPRMLSCSAFEDVSFLVMDYYEQGSLLNCVNVYRKQNLPMDEVLVLFYAAELLKIVGIIHKAGILHTDIKLENVLLYSTSSKNNFNNTWSSIFRRDGREGWSNRGLVLIDFGRSVDLKLLPEEEDTRFLIKGKHHSFNGSPLIAQGRPISHEMDWFGVADCLHWLLFQRSLEPLIDPITMKAKLPAPLKRYWQVDIWEPVFELLLNPPTRMQDCLDLVRKEMERIWERLEAWRKAPSLKSLLTRQEIMLYENPSGKKK